MVLSPEVFQQFRSARRRVQDTYNLGAANNNFQQGSVAAAYARQLGDLTTQLDRTRSKLPWSFAQRGILNSGLWQKRLADYGTDRTAAVGNLRGGYEDQAGALAFQAQQLAAQRAGGLSDIEEAERARIAAVAAALRAAR